MKPQTCPLCGTRRSISRRATAHQLRQLIAVWLRDAQPDAFTSDELLVVAEDILGALAILVRCEHPGLSPQAEVDEAPMASRPPSSRQPRDKGLGETPREEEVLDELAVGATTQEIAEDLSISIETVRTHIRNLLQKFGARNRRELVARRRWRASGPRAGRDSG